MNRAERRRLKKHIAKASEKRTGLPPGYRAPTTVTLQGGPMSGWVVTPDAPALQPDWHASLLEMKAANLYNMDRERALNADLPKWPDVDAATRERYLATAREQYPPGRYEAKGTTARWVTA